MTVTAILDRRLATAPVGGWSPTRGPSPWSTSQETVVYLRGDRLTPADLASRFGYLDAGLLVGVRTDSRRQEAVVEVRGCGTTVGEDSLIGHRPLDGGLHFEALVPTRVRWVEAGAPHLVDIDASRAVMAVLARRLRHQQETACRRRLQSLPQRVAEHLVRLSHETALGTDDTALQCLTRFDLARIVGTNRSAVSKICSGFERRGWCVITGTAIVVTDETALTSYAESGLAPAARTPADIADPEQALIDLVVPRPHLAPA